jgi:hypothetical protein
MLLFLALPVATNVEMKRKFLTAVFTGARVVVGLAVVQNAGSPKGTLPKSLRWHLMKRTLSPSRIIKAPMCAANVGVLNAEKLYSLHTKTLLDLAKCQAVDIAPIEKWVNEKFYHLNL